MPPARTHFCDEVARVQKLRKERNQSAAESAVEAVRTTAKGKENLMPAILTAVKAEATLGEISDALREVYGLYREDVSV